MITGRARKVGVNGSTVEACRLALAFAITVFIPAINKATADTIGPLDGVLCDVTATE
jgi:hypothetical protein